MSLNLKVTMMDNNNLSTKAYKILEEMIVLLRLEPGKTYSEKELIALTQMSRTPLREALLKLSAQSLVKFIPRRGLEISDINMSHQLSILETRKVLDTLLISRAARYATAYEKDKIANFQELIKKTAENGDVEEFLRIDKKLDENIFNMSRNSFAKNANEPLHTRSRRFWYYFKGKEDLKNSAFIHIALIKNIINGNEKAAVDISNEIINVLVEVVQKNININL